MTDLRPVPASLESRLQDLSPEKRALFELLMADDEAAKAKVRSVEPRLERGFAPLSFAQERLWFLEQLMPGTALFTLTSTWRVPETLDVATFERSLNEVVRRHESLRTTFAVRDGEPVQVVAPDRFLPVYFSDLAHLDPTAREAEATAIATRESLHCFGLEHGPLLRATLVRLASDDHLVVVTMHHIISDGWSIGVFWNELSAIWRAYAAGQRSPLGDPGLQFGDVATWEHESLRGEHLRTLLAYWRDQLQDLTALELPLDLPRPATPSGRGAATYLSIAAPLTAALRRLSHEAGTTLFMTLLAAFETLLHRYTGQDDVVVGTYTANRNRAEFEDVIGFFVNPLVLRADFTGSPTFRSLLAQVRRSALDAYAHQDLPFARLVQELSPDRDLSRNPLFQVAFQMLNAPQMGSATTPDDDGEPDVAREAAVLDLTCTVWEVTSGLGVELEYNTDLFTRGSVDQLSRHYHQLLEKLVSDPDRPLRTVSLLTPKERHRVVEEWNDTAVPCPARPGLTDLFDAQVSLHPDRTAVIAGDEAVSFADLGRGVARLARWLTDLGVGPEVRVGVCLPRSPDLVTALLAVLRAGGVYVPLDPTHPKDRLAYILADAAVEVLVTSTSTSPALPASTATTVVLDHDDHDDYDGAVMDADPPAPPDPAPGATAYVIYTSGSTGRPKGVAVPHVQIVNRLRWMWREHPFGSDEVACQKTSASFVDSLWELLGALLQGLPTIVVGDEQVRDLQAFVQTLQHHRVTRLWLVPSLLRELLRVPDLRRRLPTLRFWVASGEPLPRDLVEEFESRLPDADLYNLYGTSEVWDATWCKVSVTGASGPVPIGRSIANTQAYVLDDLMQPVPVGSVGELYVGGLGLGHGYVGQPRATAAAFLAHPFSRDPGQRVYRTGDLARHRRDGSIVLLGRRDSMVKLRGHRIELDEIEGVLMREAQVRRAVVLLREDTVDDPRLVAYVQLEHPGPALKQGIAGQLRAAVRRTLPEHMVPATFVVMPELPRTTSGKIDRRALPAPHVGRSLPETTFVAPRTAVEAQLAELWAALLGVEHVGVRDNFFELGGHSLLGIRMVTRVREGFGVELPLRAIFEAPTVAALALRIELGRSTDGAATAPAIVRRPREDHAMRLLPNGELDVRAGPRNVRVDGFRP
jgi:amino acid adenylation domain-containing protein